MYTTLQYYKYNLLHQNILSINFRSFLCTIQISTQICLYFYFLCIKTLDIVNQLTITICWNWEAWVFVSRLLSKISGRQPDCFRLPSGFLGESGSISVCRSKTLWTIATDLFITFFRFVLHLPRQFLLPHHFHSPVDSHHSCLYCIQLLKSVLSRHNSSGTQSLLTHRLTRHPRSSHP